MTCNECYFSKACLHPVFLFSLKICLLLGDPVALLFSLKVTIVDARSSKLICSAFPSIPSNNDLIDPVIKEIPYLSTQANGPLFLPLSFI